MMINDDEIMALFNAGINKAEISRRLSIPRSTVYERINRIQNPIINEKLPEISQNKWHETKDSESWTIETSDERIKTVEDVYKKANVDFAIWGIDRIIVNGWDITAKINTPDGDKLITKQNQQIKVILKRLVPEHIENAVNNLLDKLEKKSPICPLIKRSKLSVQDDRRALEICLCDPHYGMRCFAPGADVDQTPESMAAMMMDIVDVLLERSKHYGPFEQIILPSGNDFYHADNVWQTTTGGTGQPENDAFLHTFIGGEELMINLVDKLKIVAPVYIYSIPGNHDRTASFMLGRILKAYFRNDKNVTVNADESPYKFHRYGCNLIGYEHGHSVKPTIRLAALMANECPEDWLATKHGWREFHLGDQHRKGSSKPTMMEEQGVSIEYLPGLTAPNEWHRIKGYNWQKRAAVGFIWHYTEGLIGRPQVNIDRYSNQIMGR